MTHAQRGYTLLEMLVVILLISIAAGLLGFGLQHGLRAAKERQVVGQMVEALRSTRARAIVSSAMQKTVFDLHRLSFQAPGRPQQHWPADMRVTLHTAEQAGAAIEFYPDGSSTGGHVSIISGAREWRVNVGWLTGEVDLEELKER